MAFFHLMISGFVQLSPLYRADSSKQWKIKKEAFCLPFGYGDNIMHIASSDVEAETISQSSGSWQADF